MTGLARRFSGFTGLRKQDVVIILLSVFIGGGIFAANFVVHQGNQQQYRITYDDNPNVMTVTRASPAQTSFNLDQPQAMQDVTITITYGQVGDGIVLTPSVNGREFQVDENPATGSSRTIALTPADLRRVNKVTIEGQFNFGTRAQIQSITVTGVTGGQRTLFLVLNILSILIVIGPILIIKYVQYSRRGELEEQFPNFLRDVVEGVRAGMPLPQAIKTTRKNNYGILSDHIDDMHAKLEWGVPFEKVMSNFAEKTHSPLIKRSVNTIIQSYKSGGDIAGVLDAVGNNLKEIRKLRKERESQIYGEMVTGYIIYFVFLFVLVMLIRYFLPSLSFSQDIGPLSGGLSSDQIVATYRSVFRFLIIIQSVFSGLVIGRLSEGEIRAGGKHVAILLGIGYTVAVVFM